MVSKVSNQAEARIALDAQEAVKKRAARQAAKRELAPDDVQVVECVVLPQGHEKISMGVHVHGVGEAHYEEGERFKAEMPTAVDLYRRGYVNFEGARDAVAQADEQASRYARAEKAELQKMLDQV